MKEPVTRRALIKSQQDDRLRQQIIFVQLAVQHYDRGEWHEARTASIIAQAYGSLWVNHGAQ